MIEPLTSGLELLALLAFGWLAGDRIFDERDPVARVALAISLPLVSLLSLVNFFCARLAFPVSVHVSAGIIAAAALGLALVAPSPSDTGSEPKPRRPDRADLVAIGLALLAAAFCLLWRQSHTDDDHWVHAGLIGLFQTGHFPPVNPLIPDLPLQGHYGRDLSVAALSQLLGTDIFRTASHLATVLQTATFLILYRTAKNSLNSGYGGLLCAGSAFFGANYYARAGIFDIVADNGPLLHLYFALVLYGYWRAIETGRFRAVVFTGWILGVYALVYETYYALLLGSFLALPFAARFLDPSLVRPLARAGIGIVCCSLPFALLQGGTLSHFANNLLHPVAISTDSARMLALQEVRVTFPKEHLFTVGARPFFGRDVLRNYWLSLYLAPFTVAFLLAPWRGRLTSVRHTARARAFGLLLCGFGVLAILVPNTVSFGHFDGEYDRFLFASAVGLAGGLGVALALWGRGEAGSPLRLSRMAVVLVIVLANFAGSHVPGLGLRRGAIPYLVDIFRHRLEAPGEFLADPVMLILKKDREQPPDYEPFLRPSDLEMGRWLRAHARRGERMLANVSGHDFFGWCTVIGYAGLPMTGFGQHWPYVPGYRAVAFWSTLDEDLLRQIGVDWLYVDPAKLTETLRERLRSHPNLLLSHSRRDRTGAVRLLYRSVSSSEPRVSADAGHGVSDLGSDLQVEGLSLPAPLRSANYRQATLRVRNVGSRSIDLSGWLVPHVAFEPEAAVINRGDEPATRISLSIGAGATAEVPVHFVAPNRKTLGPAHEDGSYKVSWSWTPDVRSPVGAIPIQGRQAVLKRDPSCDCYRLQP